MFLRKKKGRTEPEADTTLVLPVVEILSVVIIVKVVATEEKKKT